MRLKRSYQSRNKMEKPRAAMSQESLTLDYPREGEIITSETYTFRISAPKTANTVDVSVNNGPWLPCRRDGEHWWYDWAHFKPGKYKVRARMRFAWNGRVKITLLRRFQAR